jgi:hypothetical protein
VPVCNPNTHIEEDFVFLSCAWVSYRRFESLRLRQQPMKAVSAAILTGGLTPGEVAAAGMMLGIVRLALGVASLIGKRARIDSAVGQAGFTNFRVMRSLSPMASYFV